MKRIDEVTGPLGATDMAMLNYINQEAIAFISPITKRRIPRSHPQSPSRRLSAKEEDKPEDNQMLFDSGFILGLTFESEPVDIIIENMEIKSHPTDYGLLKESDESDEEKELEEHVRLAEPERPWYLNEEVWSGFVREEAAFQRDLPRLLESPEYRGTWVAFHGGKPVDHDEDFDRLSTRFRKSQGDVSVYIGAVAIPEDKEIVYDLGGYGTLQLDDDQ